jgi:hypothetical protein
MALAMTRPWKHPKTGVYWIRKRVPEALRVIIGKQEEKRSLGTRDPSEAKLRLLQALSELETKWKNLQAGPQTLSEQEAHTLVRPVHDEWIRRYRANPSEQRFWNTEIGVAGVWELPPAIPEALRAKTIGDAKLAPVRAILQWAVDNDRLPANPASRVVIDVKSKPSESIRSFSEDEAKLVLKRARSERKAALRWVCIHDFGL